MVLCNKSPPSSLFAGFPNKVTIPCPKNSSLDFLACCAVSSTSLDSVTQIVRCLWDRSVSGFMLGFYSPLLEHSSAGPFWPLPEVEQKKERRSKEGGGGEEYNLFFLVAVFLYSSWEKNNLERCIMIEKLLIEQLESSENSHFVTMNPELCGQGCFMPNWTEVNEG